MSSDVLEPTTESGENPVPGSPPPVPPPFLLDGSTSGDELTVSLTQVAPDPLLGEFVNDPPPEEALSSARVVAPAPNPESHEVPRADALNALAGLDLGRDDVDVAAGADLSVSSAEALAALDLGASASSSPSAERTPRVAVSNNDDDDDEDDDDESPTSQGSSLGMMLLASYASAVTLGLIWVLWTGRKRPEPSVVDAPTPAAEAKPDPGARADRSHRIAPPPPIPADHLATLGKPIRLGQIEVTPLAITTGPVVLERDFDGNQTKSGGENALILRLRLRNLSPDLVIAPLDEGFLRDRPRADPDSYIETSAGEAPIAQFPLAVASEWSIVGQEFRDLKPGETLESLVVSAPDALARLTPEMTWRVRLRTDLNHTDALGVRFRESDIQRPSKP